MRAFPQDVRSKIANQSLDIGLAEQRRDFAHGDGATPKPLEHQAKLREFVRVLGQRLGLIFADLDNFRDEKPLPRHAAESRPLFRRSGHDSRKQEPEA